MPFWDTARCAAALSGISAADSKFEGDESAPHDRVPAAATLPNISPPSAPRKKFAKERYGQERDRSCRALRSGCWYLQARLWGARPPGSARACGRCRRWSLGRYRQSGAEKIMGGNHRSESARIHGAARACVTGDTMKVGFFRSEHMGSCLAAISHGSRVMTHRREPVAASAQALAIKGAQYPRAPRRSHFFYRDEVLFSMLAERRSDPGRLAWTAATASLPARPSST